MITYGRPVGLLGAGTSGDTGVPTMMYQITLPRSVYWQDSAQWVNVSEQSPTANYRRQVIVNNSLWVFNGSNAYEVDLDTGDTLNTVSGCNLGGNITASGGGYHTGATAYPGNVCTDGTNIYWCNDGALMQLNTVTKSVTNLGNIEGNSKGRTLVYSSFDNCVYMIGGTRISSNTVGPSRTYIKYQLESTGSCQSYDISANSVITKTSLPISVSYPWVFADNTTGEIYFGSGYRYTTNTSANNSQSGSYNHTLYKFNPSTNTYTQIKRDLPFNFLDNQSYINIGERMLSFNGQNVYSWNPMTGETYSDQMPEPLADVVLFNNMAVKDNALYSSQGSGLWKCVFYENIPEDAPIVAKIYKGNKYHSTQPFTIHGEDGDVNVTTVQQVAGKDIPIKMYTYDNAGGQLLIIETGV